MGIPVKETVSTSQCPSQPQQLLKRLPVPYRSRPEVSTLTPPQTQYNPQGNWLCGSRTGTAGLFSLAIPVGKTPQIPAQSIRAKFPDGILSP